MKLFDFYFENPFATYWKVRKIFKRPKMKMRFSITRNIYRPLILYFHSFDVSCKWKYNEIRFEYCPYISISLFRYFNLTIVFEYENESLNDIVWETMLEYVYDRKNRSIDDIVKNNTWRDVNGVAINAKDYIKYNKSNISNYGRRINKTLS